MNSQDVQWWFVLLPIMLLLLYLLLGPVKARTKMLLVRWGRRWLERQRKRAER